jgi:hypothetical protein
VCFFGDLISVYRTFPAATSFQRSLSRYPIVDHCFPKQGRRRRGWHVLFRIPGFLQKGCVHHYLLKSSTFFKFQHPRDWPASAASGLSDNFSLGTLKNDFAALIYKVCIIVLMTAVKIKLLLSSVISPVNNNNIIDFSIEGHSVNYPV